MRSHLYHFSTMELQFVVEPVDDIQCNKHACILLRLYQIQCILTRSFPGPFLAELALHLWAFSVVPMCSSLPQNILWDPTQFQQKIVHVGGFGVMYLAQTRTNLSKFNFV